jgi:hypothetical protein
MKKEFYSVIACKHFFISINYNGKTIIGAEIHKFDCIYSLLIGICFWQLSIGVVLQK